MCDHIISDNNNNNSLPFQFLTVTQTLIHALVFVCRARWLTCPDPDAEELFRMVGEVFIYWSKSHVSPLFSMMLSNLVFSILCFLPVICHQTFGLSLQNFKREEQNFVVMNEINNMSFLTADSKSKMSKVRVDK